MPLIFFPLILTPNTMVLQSASWKQLPFLLYLLRCVSELVCMSTDAPFHFYWHNWHYNIHANVLQGGTLFISKSPIHYLHSRKNVHMKFFFPPQIIRFWFSLKILCLYPSFLLPIYPDPLCHSTVMRFWCLQYYISYIYIIYNYILYILYTLYFIIISDRTDKIYTAYGFGLYLRLLRSLNSEI